SCSETYNVMRPATYTELSTDQQTMCRYATEHDQVSSAEQRARHRVLRADEAEGVRRRPPDGRRRGAGHGELERRERRGIGLGAGHAGCEADECDDDAHGREMEGMHLASGCLARRLGFQPGDPLLRLDEILALL